MNEEYRELFKKVGDQFELHLNLAKEQTEAILKLEGKVAELEGRVKELERKVKMLTMFG